MDELIEALRERAAFEDDRCRNQISDAGLGVEIIYSGSVTGALLREAAAALEAAREDAERYRHLRSNESNGAVDLCVVRVEWSEQGNGPARYEVLTEDRADQAIDQARGEGGAE